MARCDDQALSQSRMESIEARGAAMFAFIFAHARSLIPAIVRPGGAPRHLFGPVM